MNCHEVREQLALLVYGDLGSAEAAALEQHVAGCPACQQERAELQATRRLLGTADAVSAPVDLCQVYQRAVENEARRARRWRRGAALLAVAASLLLVLAAWPIEIRIAAQQFTLRWGHHAEPAPAPPVPPVPKPADELGPRLAASEERLQLVRDLLIAMKDEAERRDATKNEELLLLARKLVALEQQMNQRWTLTERNVDALYLLSQKGAER